MATRVLLADDHRIFVESLRDRIGRAPGMKVVAEAGNGEDAIRLFAEHRPDIVILDISMPGINGIEAARLISAIDKKAGLIMLSMHADKKFVAEALKAGARGYLLKESAFEDLISAIRKVLSGGFFLSPSINSQVIGEYAQALKAPADGGPTALTRREKEVLRLVADGHSTKIIAKELGLSIKTIEAHRAQIMDKLGLRSIAELTKYAIREGLTSTN
jgi:two-component system, NarL family, response regulator NreC